MVQKLDTSEAPRIGIEEAKAEFDRGTALYVDLRNPEQYEESHIRGAIPMPLKDLFTRYRELPRDRTLVFY